MLSVVIITFNEAKNIARCIQSVQDIADDIVVLDSFSTDGTQALAKQGGARVIEHAFDGHIEQKNRAITLAKYPFILSLDADEALSPELKNAIIQVKENPSADGYSFNRLTNYCGSWIKHGNWYPDVKLRLWNSKKGKWGGMNPHDRFIMDKDANIAHLNGNLLHYSFYTFEEHLAQIKKFTDISSKAAVVKGKRSTPFNLIINPIAKFIGGYFVKLGFLDGKPGFRIAWYSAYATYLKYSKMLKIQNK